MKFVAYKIYNPLTNKFSKGGERPDWGKRGKAWGAIGYIKTHLSLVRFTGLQEYMNCTLQEYTTDGIKATPMLDFMRETFTSYYNKKGYIAPNNERIVDLLELTLENKCN